MVWLNAWGRVGVRPEGVKADEIICLMRSHGCWSVVLFFTHSLRFSAVILFCPGALWPFRFLMASIISSSIGGESVILNGAFASFPVWIGKSSMLVGCALYRSSHALAIVVIFAGDDFLRSGSVFLCHRPNFP